LRERTFVIIFFSMERENLQNRDRRAQHLSQQATSATHEKGEEGEGEGETEFHREARREERGAIV
jgi:hypothetical protein